ncbi:hypothetical protein LWI29_002136 [Acer saccharum]|uniref:Uncharacterized protein n=1 Tax=Acer saccharum TaxID=4024 RepID=A0AA39RSN7_ACESA|nr:hypothetical protein LWI29_002136 [Acer saccharum]
MDLVRMLISYNGRWEELSHGSQRTCRTVISDNDDVQFVLREDKAVLQVCVTLVERRFEDPQQIRDEHYGSFSGSNQVFSQRSLIFLDGIRQCSNNVCLEPYETVNLDRSYAAPNFDDGDNRVIVVNHPQEHQTFKEPIHEEPTHGSALPLDVRGTPADTENVNAENVNTENVNTENVNDMIE